jgi:hypothetical protein
MLVVSLLSMVRKWLYVGRFSSFHGEEVVQIGVAVKQQSYQDD